MDTERYSYIDIDRKMDMMEFLLAVEKTVDLVYHDEAILPDDRNNMCALNLAMFTYKQATMAAADANPEWGSLSTTDRLNLGIDYTHDRWITVTDYCRQMGIMNLNPTFDLEFQLEAANDALKHESDIPDYRAFYEEYKRLILTCIKSMHEEADRVVQENMQIPTVGAPTESKDQLKKELIEEYCQLLNDLGTFYADWTKYEDPEKQQKCKRLLEIYQELIS